MCCPLSSGRDPPRSGAVATPQAAVPAHRGEVGPGSQQPPEICVVRRSLFLQAPPFASHHEWDECSRLCCCWPASRICCSFSPLYLSSSLLSCLRKKKRERRKKGKPWRVHYPQKNKKSGKMFDLDPTHGSQAALPRSHRAMLKGFCKRSAKAASESLFLLFNCEPVQRCFPVPSHGAETPSCLCCSGWRAGRGWLLQRWHVVPSRRL